AQFDGADDVKFRFLSLGREAVEAAVVYIDGLVDDALLEQTLLRPLLRWAAAASPGAGAALRAGPGRLGRSVLPAGAVGLAGGLPTATAALLQGDAVFASRGDARGLQVVNGGWESRGGDDPLLEVTVRGARDSFSENLLWNTGL